MVFRFIVIINADNRAGERGDLTEGYEDGFVDLSLRCEPRSHIEEREPADGKNGCDYELYELCVNHGVFRLTVQR